jgi:hypothetical protein
MNMIEFEGRKVPATYLGDAVYAIYDGYGYWLRLNDHRNKEGQIYLEWPVIDSLFAFVENCKQIGKTSERKEPTNLATTDSEQEG